MTEQTPETGEGMSFEGALDRLREITARLEGNHLELDDSLALFEEGVRLLRFAEGVLGSADTRLKQLLEDAGGSFRLADFSEEL
jgi:exodeoxyribonuclease VII small subunit